MLGAGDTSSISVGPSFQGTHDPAEQTDIVQVITCMMMVMKGKATICKPSVCSQRTGLTKRKAAYGSFANTCEQINDKARSRKRQVTFSEVKKKELRRKTINCNHLPGFCPIGYSSITFDKLLGGNEGGDTVFNAAHW